MEFKTFLIENIGTILILGGGLVFLLINISVLKPKFDSPVSVDFVNEFISSSEFEKYVTNVGKSKNKKNKQNLHLKNSIYENLNSHSSEISASSAMCLNLDFNGNITYNQKIFDRYFDAIIECINKAKKSLLIMDLLDHRFELDIAVDDKEITEFYKILEKSHNRYFLEVENLLQKNKELVYVRILVFPPLSKTYREIYGIKNIPLNSESISSLIFKPTQNHLNRMFKLVEESKINKNNFQLYFLETPIRSFSELIIDYDYWLNEIDIINKFGISRPDRLFINNGNVSKEMSKLIVKERDIIESMIKNGAVKKLDKNYLNQLSLSTNL